ncbi:MULTISPECIES: hypothetical protein [unclassified Rhizobium]|nr:MULTISPECIES: hypothetical protein [unclassified Rhizobium]MBB3318258.1 hypothetical protein [Rhizobium sp. BK181]MCS4094063.1 hypothetical protein [Rhizobium sp. BK176]
MTDKPIPILPSFHRSHEDTQGDELPDINRYKQRKPPVRIKCSKPMMA